MVSLDRRCAFRRIEADGAFAKAFGDDFFEVDECAAHNEEDILGVDLDILLVGVLAAPFRRDVGDGPFDDFEEGLLNAFAGNVAGDRDVAVGFADLVDLIDVDDAVLGARDVVVGGLEEAEDDVFDIFPDIARFGQSGGVGNGEGDVEDARQGFGDEGFSRAGGAEEEHVRFAELDLALFMRGRGCVCSGCRRRRRSSSLRSLGR